MEKKIFGYIGNETVYSFVLKSSKLEAEILNYGGIIRSLKVIKDNELTDVVLGFDSLEQYVDGKGYHGAIVGRFANRIRGGEFFIGDKKYVLTKNNNGNCLHGGNIGFNKKIWAYEIKNNSLILKLFSPDGEEGFPGNLNVSVKYSICEDELAIEYSAVSDKDTVVSFTNHSYFNLNGEGNGDISKHFLKIDALGYTPIDEYLVPIGKIESVIGTPFDFRNGKMISQDVNISYPQFVFTNGYDHNYALSGEGFRKVSEAIGDRSNIKLQVFTDACGMQLLTNDGDSSIKGKGNKFYGRRCAFCLETGFFPDSPNCQSFPSPILKRDTVFKSKTTFKIS